MPVARGKRIAGVDGRDWLYEKRDQDIGEAEVKN